MQYATMVEMAGTLYVVSTPIGNLGDITDRAKTILASVDRIACEDTRVTAKLLNHFGIRTKMTSYHEHNEARRTRELLSRLLRGESVALVSDAGTPALSDPGFRLVRAARAAGVPIRAAPGASALLSALAVAGLPTSSFTFAGFLPPRGAARRKAIAALAELPHTLVLFEAPTRIGRLLEELAEAMGPRPASLCREMTKLHEEHRAGTLPELSAWAKDRRFRGELTLVVGGTETIAADRGAPSPAELRPRFQELKASGLSSREAAKRLAREHGLSARTIYNELAVSEESA